MDQAQCRKEKVPVKNFFPVRGESRKIAKATCAKCPVATECENYAERTGSLGIWNGQVRSPKVHDEEIDAPQDSIG